MGLDIEYIHGQTPIDEDEKEGLLIPSITTLAELNEFEQLNIQKAIEWTLTKKFKTDQIISEPFVRDLHKKMFGDVWSWAGSFRKSNKNIGVDKHTIGISLKQLLDDCHFWIDNNTYDPDEISIRFKHRIVDIHCFPNGNGRHSRLIADVLSQQVFNRPVFTWNKNNLVSGGDERTTYLKAIKIADQGDVKPLIEFARPK